MTRRLNPVQRHIRARAEQRVFEAENQLLEAVLIADLVLTTVQLERRGLTQTAERLGLRPKPLDVRTLATSKTSERTVHFVALDRATLKLRAPELFHLAGLAEIRQVLGESPAVFRRVSDRSDVRCPDAMLWYGADLNRAVEFDAGYQNSVMRAKLEAFGYPPAVPQVGEHLGFAGTLWATTSERRARRIREKVLPTVAAASCGADHPREVITVRFW